MGFFLPPKSSRMTVSVPLPGPETAVLDAKRPASPYRSHTSSIYGGTLRALNRWEGPDRLEHTLISENMYVINGLAPGVICDTTRSARGGAGSYTSVLSHAIFLNGKCRAGTLRNRQAKGAAQSP